MRRLRIEVVAGLALVLVLSAVAPALLAATPLDDPQAEGKVTSFEAGKSIAVQVGNETKEYKIDAETKIEGDLAVGKEVKVWVKDGVATKIAVK